MHAIIFDGKKRAEYFECIINNNNLSANHIFLIRVLVVCELGSYLGLIIRLGI